MRFYVKAYEDFGDRIGERLSRNLAECHTTVDCLILVNQEDIEIQPLFKPVNQPHILFLNRMRINKRLILHRCVNGDPVL